MKDKKHLSIAQSKPKELVVTRSNICKLTLSKLTINFIDNKHIIATLYTGN